MSRRILFSTLLFSLIPFAAIAGGISYNVEFEGLDDSKALKEIKLASHLTSLKKRPPASINALRYRADSDIPSLLKVLQAHGYYEGKVNIQIHEIYNDVNVIVMIDPGPRYRLESFDIHLYCQSPETTNDCCHVSLGDAGVQLNKPAQTEAILDAELKVLQRLSECGYPLAKIENRDVVVDGKTKGVRVKLDVKTGQKAEFGPTAVVGAKRVKPRYIEQKLQWDEGEEYDSRLVDKTQNLLIDSGLFSSVLISHEENLSSNGEIPLKIEVSETKHKSVNVGVSYQTVFGPGVTFGWANRNVGGMGRTLSFQGDITRISQTGVATYLHPDFNRIGQDMIAQAQAAHEDIFAYSMRSYSIMDRFERQINRRLRGGLGLKGDRLYVTESVQNGNYWLLEMPLYIRWSSANSLLNPTRGGTLEYTVTPALNVADSSDFYLTQQFTGSIYNALDEKEKIVLAQKLTLGFIFSNGLPAVPLCNRFLGGTEADLRGYRYKSVSPLVHGKPIGGRSAIYYTFETRFRLTNTIGLVPFFDMGSVYTTEYPTLHGKWFKSAGLGFRFFTFMGPFRVDLAFPLDRRKDIDTAYKVFVSIGQMF
ncbi:MAG: BamA/TamA family outer membrane protein [Verrucomicrobia bacterium]|nr:BamA/TamA family outer membrane protein [Verrucomicrobiota bacterium]